MLCLVGDPGGIKATAYPRRELIPRRFAVSYYEPSHIGRSCFGAIADSRAMFPKESKIDCGKSSMTTF